MAHRIAAADGPWATAATWGVADSTSLLDAQNGNQALTTSFVSSSAFTPGAITIDGIAVKVASRAASPSGTMSVRLEAGGAAVAGTTVTIDVADLPENIATPALSFDRCSIGWVFFRFAAPVTLLAATAYTLQATTSVASQVNLFRNATATNWARMLRTTTTGVPGAGDSIFVVGEWTAAATQTTRTVTFNDTSGTDFGSGDVALASVGIGSGGVLTWSTAPASAFVLRLSGVLQVWQGGAYRMGTEGAPIPRSSTADLQFDPGVNGGAGWISWGEWETWGESRTVGLDVTWCLLNTDEAAGQTVLGVDRETGWLSGDDIGIAATTRTVSQNEERTLAANATATELTVSAGLTNAHEGTSPVQAEVILLTRNVKVRSLSTTLMGYGTAVAGSVRQGWTECQYLGMNTSNKLAAVGILATMATAVTIAYCAFRNGQQRGIDVVQAALAPSYTFRGNVAYAQGTQSMTFAQGPAVVPVRIDGFVTISSGINLTGALVLDANDIRCSSMSTLALNIGSGSGAFVTGEMRDTVVHTAALLPTIDFAYGLTLAGGAIYRMGGASGGLNITGRAYDILLRDLAIFGNPAANVVLAEGERIRFLRCTFAGDTSFSTPRGLLKNNSTKCETYLGQCTLGPTTGIFVPHTTADIDGTATGAWDLVLNNTSCLSATKFGASLFTDSRFGGLVLREQRVGGVTNVHQTRIPSIGTIAVTASVTRSSPRAQQLTPESVYMKLRSGAKRFAARVGARLTFTVYVRKNGAYTGAAPRLVLQANPAIGITDDTVLDTHTAAADAWEALTGQSPIALEDGLMQVYVDCDGTAGDVYVDDWAAQST